VSSLRLSFLYCWVLLLCSTSAFAQAGLDDFGYPQLTKEEAVSILNRFRSSRIPGDYCLKFKITHKPRQGESSKPIEGVLWASWINGGPLIRVEMKDAIGANYLAFIGIKNSALNQSWIARDKQPVTSLKGNEMAQSIAEDLIICPFDLIMPYTHWADTRYVATERSRGRAVHYFESTNPEPQAFPTKVVFGIDRSYQALTEAKYHDTENKVSKNFTINDFAKVDEQWMINTCDLRDEKTRNVDSLKITEAAFRLELDPQIFNPENLSTPAPLPPATLFKSL